MKRAISLFLALALALALAPAALLADSESYGSEVWLRDTELQQGVIYSDNIFWSGTYNGPRHERYFTYTPGIGSPVRPVAAYGEGVCSRLTTLAAAQSYEALGYRVVGAINGDFYDPNRGFPLGLLVSGGELRSGGESYYAVGFRADGSVVMGEPRLSTIVRDFFGTELTLAAFNKPRVDGSGAVLLTYDFRADHTTGVTTDGVTVLASVAGQRPAIGGTTALCVLDVIAGAEAVPLEEDQVALTISATGTEAARTFLGSLRSGDMLQVSFETEDPRWRDVTEAVGALYLLVSNGIAQSGFTDTSTRARTAVGVKANGDLILYTIDGNQSGVSVGSTLSVLAKRMAELGCVTALCLDGGGSTTAAAALPGDFSAQLLSSPSDGSPRSVTNHILLISPGYPTGIPNGTYLSTAGPAVLTGGSLELSAGMVDTNFFPLDGGTVLFTASDGYVEDGVFHAPDWSGPVTITASAGGSGAQITVQVVDQPDAYAVQQDGQTVAELSLLPGESVQLGVSMTYRHMPLPAALGDFVWAVDPALGFIDEAGVLTAGDQKAAGTLTASSGSFSLSVPITVDPRYPFVDMEGHWATRYVSDMYRQGIFTGVPVGDAVYAYPDQGVTREAFAALLARYLKLDLTAYAESVAPFADMDKVSDWARSSVCAMYDLGIMTGTANAAGELFCSPQKVLTRSEAVTMLGRVLARTGEVYPPAELDQFPDAAAIQPYALEHFQVLVGLAVINGNNQGLLDPDGQINRSSICKMLSTLPA